jgi:ribosome-associated heat shock protein Hsp15|tara:strand:+ start:126 stop:500 length:375 start_codon:yes stop_codon:yes gene_type:complete
LRIDKWLVFARFFKTRTKVTKAIEKKMIFLNGSVLKKQSQLLKLEDDILIKNSNEIVRIIVKQFAEKRDAYSKAKFLYEKKSSIVTELVKIKSNVNEGFQNFSRPNKKERRALTQLKNTENFIK